MEEFFETLLFCICILGFIFILPILFSPIVAFLEAVDIEAIVHSIMEFIGEVYNGCYTFFLDMWEEIL